MALVNCPECDARVSTAAVACPSCGYPIGQSRVRSGFPNPQKPRVDAPPMGTATAGMICGLAGSLLLFMPCISFISILPSILGIVVSWVALSRIRRQQEEGWGRAITGLLCGIMASLIFLVAVTTSPHLIVPGWESADVRNFNTATRQLHDLLTSTGNEDRAVLDACTAVEVAFKKVDRSGVSSEQAAAMESVANAASLWKNQLTLMKLNAVSASLGTDNSSTAATDMKVARLTFPGIRSSIESYLNTYD